MTLAIVALLISGLYTFSVFSTKVYFGSQMPNGSSLCAMDTPFHSISVNDIVGIPPGLPPQLQCAFYCTEEYSNAACNAFNYVGNGFNSGQCQFYNASQQTHCSVTRNNCLHYRVSDFVWLLWSLAFDCKMVLHDQIEHFTVCLLCLIQSSLRLLIL
jgi:hypothetical protein